MTSFLANSRPVPTHAHTRTHRKREREREKQLAQDAVAVLRNIIKLIRHILRPSGGAARETLRNLCSSAAAWAIDTFESSTELLDEGNSLVMASFLPQHRHFLPTVRGDFHVRVKRWSRITGTRKQVVVRAANLLFLSLSLPLFPCHVIGALSLNRAARF